MPVTWEIRNRVLIVNLVGDYAFDDPVQAVNEGLLDPQFRPGTSLLIMPPSFTEPVSTGLYGSDTSYCRSSPVQRSRSDQRVAEAHRFDRQLRRTSSKG
jgi:hypothetical protein